MNREVYALQLIDEETGEVLKDVTPITESISVIHNGEKLNEVLDLQRDKIQEQSKSNLVLVTTMQKLLSEKIEELEREYSWTKNLPTNLIKFRKTIYKKRGEETIAIPVNIPMDGEYAVFCKASVYGDKKPDRLRVGHNAGSEVFGENGSIVKQVSTHIAGIKNIPFFAGANAGESIKNVGKFENLMMVKNDDLLIDVPFYRNIELIQEELDFYKSQLEKLKLTQEVDLNLLLTL